eukprot:GHVL01007694.1.p1 GENE.GHVL01007694.1~~GHVL01007694.1.p1  ORF type:complete len:370 (+),score=117.48 GHVL01007694.1:59-1168(+)
MLLKNVRQSLLRSSWTGGCVTNLVREVGESNLPLSLGDANFLLSKMSSEEYIKNGKYYNIVMSRICNIFNDLDAIHLGYFIYKIGIIKHQQSLIIGLNIFDKISNNADVYTCVAIIWVLGTNSPIGKWLPLVEKLIINIYGKIYLLPSRQLYHICYSLAKLNTQRMNNACNIMNNEIVPELIKRLNGEYNNIEKNNLEKNNLYNLEKNNLYDLYSGNDKNNDILLQDGYKWNSSLAFGNVHIVARLMWSCARFNINNIILYTLFAESLEYKLDELKLEELYIIDNICNDLKLDLKNLKIKIQIQSDTLNKIGLDSNRSSRRRNYAKKHRRVVFTDPIIKKTTKKIFEKSKLTPKGGVAINKAIDLMRAM